MMPGMLTGMFALIVPSFLVCVGIAILVYRKWDTSARD